MTRHTPFVFDRPTELVYRALPDDVLADTARRAARIAALNDALRTCCDPITAMTLNGAVVVTRALAASGEDVVARALAAVAAFSDFTPANDPHGEHDFAFLTVDGGEQQIFFKIDYFDQSLRFASSDPASAAVTRRVLTVGFADDY